MATKLRPYCATCRAHYRSATLHQSTEAHQRKAFRAAHPRAKTDAMNGSGAANRRRAARSARRSLDGFLRDTTYRVGTYRRSRPNDGTRKVVKVRPYYRRKADQFVQLASIGGDFFRVYHDTATGAARSIRKASAATVRAWIAEGRTIL